MRTLVKHFDDCLIYSFTRDQQLRLCWDGQLSQLHALLLGEPTGGRLPVIWRVTSKLFRVRRISRFRKNIIITKFFRKERGWSDGRDNLLFTFIQSDTTL